MENYERDFRRNHEGQSYRNSDRYGDDRHMPQNRRNPDQGRGGYTGMPNRDQQFRNERGAEGGAYGRSASRPERSYGESSYRENQDRYNRQQDDQRGSQSRYSRQPDADRNYGSRSRQDHLNNDHYRYGDPNPYMDYKREGGYEKNRGTGWRNESDRNEGTNRYARQDNSYTTGGEGRRYDSFGRDEKDNFGHNMRDRLDHGHVDRNEHEVRRSDNDYSPGRHYGSSGSYRESNRIPEWKNVSDKYSRKPNQPHFDHTDDNYPRSSSRHDRHRSGPDWSADSAASDYSQSDLRG